MRHIWWVINDESPDNPCIWSRGNLYPFFWCKWYLVSSFQICVGGLLGDDVIMTSSSSTTKISLVYHVISLVPVSSHILNQTSFYKTMIGTSIQCSVSRDSHCHMMKTRDVIRMTSSAFCHVIMGSHDIPIYSILKCSNRTKFTCNFSLYMWGVTSKIPTIFEKCCNFTRNPLYFCASEFRSKAIWPTADNRLSPKRERPWWWKSH